MDPGDLIGIARHLAAGEAGSKQGRPRQADLLRRAVSTACSALFHALAGCGADLLVGATPAYRSNSAWRQVYRAWTIGLPKINARITL